MCIRDRLKPCTELLAGIPSIVYGFFGMVIIVPAVRAVAGVFGDVYKRQELSLLPDMPHCWVVLCKPPFAVPTKEVYQEIDSVDILEHPDNKGMMAALNQGDYEGVCAYLSNVMETVTAAKRRQIGEIKSFLAENGADGTLMSGSGPTVYGLFSDESRAKTAAKMLRRRFADTFLTETCN